MHAEETRLPRQHPFALGLSEGISDRKTLTSTRIPRIPRSMPSLYQSEIQLLFVLHLVQGEASSMHGSAIRETMTD